MTDIEKAELKAENEVDEYKKYKVERQLGRMALE